MTESSRRTRSHNPVLVEEDAEMGYPGSGGSSLRLSCWQWPMRPLSCLDTVSSHWNNLVLGAAASTSPASRQCSGARVLHRGCNSSCSATDPITHDHVRGQCLGTARTGEASVRSADLEVLKCLHLPTDSQAGGEVSSRQWVSLGVPALRMRCQRSRILSENGMVMPSSRSRGLCRERASSRDGWQRRWT